MPPRHAYWTILIGDSPTAFRARERDELLPTFERLRAKQPDAVLKWFERGRLWASPEEARGPAPIPTRELRTANDSSRTWALFGGKTSLMSKRASILSPPIMTAH